jgi:hypothetical protein
MTDQLKPCPFCGSSVEIFNYDIGDGDFNDIRCTNADCFLGVGSGWAVSVSASFEMDELIRRWNNRPSDLLHVQEIELLEHGND